MELGRGEGLAVSVKTPLKQTPFSVILVWGYSEMFPARVEKGDDVIYQALHNEIVLLNMKTQQYFGLDDVGSDMWKLLVEHGDLDIVADRLSAEYDVDRATVREDLEVLIRNLMAAGLLKSADAPAQGTVG